MSRAKTDEAKTVTRRDQVDGASLRKGMRTDRFEVVSDSKVEIEDGEPTGFVSVRVVYPDKSRELLRVAGSAPFSVTYELPA